MENQFIETEEDIAEKVMSLLITFTLSLVGCWGVHKALPLARGAFQKAGLKGRDMGKRDPVEVPESLGMVSGTLFLMVMFAFVLARFSTHTLSSGHPFPEELLCKLLIALLCILCMLFLGFADDVLNLPWRYKLVLPTIASAPLLISHYIHHQSTTIALPLHVHAFLGASVDIGPLYYLYMSMLALFCTNAINIYAGVNGLEVGQSLVIAVSVVVFNVLEMLSFGFMIDKHHLSISILLPFVATSLPLYWANRYPASVFVGDTFTYFAGMTFAVVGVLGFFSKTLLLFLIPQILNFLYSAPQIFKLLPCPRHRLPRYDADTDTVHFSRVTVRQDSLHPQVARGLTLLAALRVVHVEVCDSDDKFDGQTSLTFNNFTLINYVLVWSGPLHERSLTRLLLLLQAFFSVIGLLLRYPVGEFFYAGTSVLL